jgi:hypothetical protein
MGVEQDALQLDVPAGLGSEIEVGRGDEARHARRHHFVDDGQGFVHGDVMEGDAEQDDGFGGGEFHAAF